MKVTCTCENFKKAIFYTERAVSRQTTLPILNNILLEASKKGLKICATNLEIGITTWISAKIEKEGQITISAKLLSNFANNLLSEENIELEIVEQSLKIKSGSIKAVLKGFSATDFPLIPQKNTEFQFKLPYLEFKRVVTKSLSSVAFNESRQELNGVNMIMKENELFFASTDSFRLSESKINLSKEDKNEETYLALIEKRNNIIIPASTLAEVNRVISIEEDGRVKMSIEEGQIFFEIKGTLVVSRLISGKYPEYQHIVPQEFKTRIVMEKDLIARALKLASVFGTAKSNEVVLDIKEDKKISIEIVNTELGENTSQVAADITGPAQKIVLNARYFLDGITQIASSKVAVLINSEATPIALREIYEKTGEVLEGYTYIIMPIKN